MVIFRTNVFMVLFLILSISCLAQEETGPVMIKIHRIVLGPSNKYIVNIPTFEFHMYLQKSFKIFRSAVTADYDYQRQDMGFGMRHSLFRYVVNPGISVEDNLYFREVFSDSTGIWRRKQSISPFLIHELNEHSAIGIEFKFEREWSPNRRMGTKIISNRDRSIRVYYLLKKGENSIWNNRIFYIAFERSYRIFNGEYNYLLIEALTKYSRELTKSFYYKGIFSYMGNITPQQSPIFFLGGYSTLIGYENHEFWGRRIFYLKNLMEFKPFPNFSFSIKNTRFARFSFLSQFDIGQTRGAAKFKDMKSQTRDIKTGLGIGLGMTADLPYMHLANLYFLIAVPSSDYSDIKYYTGLGGFIN